MFIYWRCRLLQIDNRLWELMFRIILKTGLQSRFSRKPKFSEGPLRGFSEPYRLVDKAAGSAPKAKGDDGALKPELEEH
ncbi:hypothetical protein J6590_015099 [Homalodisca vitripennis]|nr:hypothetical protein J6590_015099 [Homalodisca vitripennis]